MKNNFKLNEIITVLLLILGGVSSVNAQTKIKRKPHIPTEKDMGAYLFVFFTDATHSLFMATSHDGYTFTAVNGGKPVIAGDTIAAQKGIRDPHIYRGPDGAFYIIKKN